MYMLNFRVLVVDVNTYAELTPVLHLPSDFEYISGFEYSATN